MKIKIKDRTGADLFSFLELADENKDRANEWAVTEFVELDDEPMNLETFIGLTNEQQVVIKGRVFTTKVKGVKQNDEELIFNSITIKRKKIPHNFIESMQLKMQKMNDKGESSITAIIKSAIGMFYDISISELEKMPYQISAFMFNYINSFLTRVTEPSDEFNLDDI